MYKVIITKAAVKELENTPKSDQILIYQKIEDLQSGNFANDKPLKGKHKDKFRKRSGNYRIIYLKENNILLITIIRIAHRKEVY